MVTSLAISDQRSTVIFAKFTAIFITNIFLTFLIFIVGIMIGFLLRIDDFTWQLFNNNGTSIMIVSGITILLSAPFGFFASFGRGYLLSLGAIFIILIFSQIIVAIGYGEYFPWSVPVLYSGITGVPFKFDTLHSALIAITSLTGILGTWW